MEAALLATFPEEFEEKPSKHIYTTPVQPSSSLVILIPIFKEAIAAKKAAVPIKEKPPNLRRFFDSFAAKQNFNPLDVKMWYTVPATQLGKQKVLKIFLIVPHPH